MNQRGNVQSQEADPYEAVGHWLREAMLGKVGEQRGPERMLDFFLETCWKGLLPAGVPSELVVALTPVEPIDTAYRLAPQQ